MKKFASLLLALAVAASGSDEIIVRQLPSHDPAKILLQWEGRQPPYKIQRSFNGRTWTDITYHIFDNSYTLPVDPANPLAFFRVRTVGALTGSITLAWDPNPVEDEVAGYVLRYGTSHGNYPNTVDVGNVTTATINRLQVGTPYFFVVTAYNAGLLSSGPSNEVVYLPPAP